MQQIEMLPKKRGFSEVDIHFLRKIGLLIENIFIL
jgi:hypothetical protein